MPQAIFICKTCKKKFNDYPSNKPMYCSMKCVQHHLKALTHGDSYTRLYQIWCGMKTRCLLKTSKAFPYYGGRGIKIDSAWAFSYLAFKEWALAAGYRDGLQIDRIDVNGDYEPSNCRWVNRFQQMANTRKRCDGLTSKYKGVSWNSIGRNWKAQININGKSTYIGVYCSEAEAARAYDSAAKRLRGKYALLNFAQGGAPSWSYREKRQRRSSSTATSQ